MHVNSEIFAKNVTRQFGCLKYTTGANDLLSPFREGFIFPKFRENKTLTKMSEFTAFVA